MKSQEEIAVVSVKPAVAQGDMAQLGIVEQIYLSDLLLLMRAFDII